MKIIIPMAGTGRRFMQAGYAMHKSLITVEGKPVIESVINLFPGEDDFIFICNKRDLATSGMRGTLTRIKPRCRIIGIEEHDKGPVYTTLHAFKFIRDEEPAIVNYCDFALLWNYNKFKEKMEKTECDGCVTAYKGFHPHTLGDTHYAYARCDKKNYLIEIKEKEPFTDNRMQEYSSSGTYYFKKGLYIKKYFKELMELGIKKNGEYYVSLVYNLLKRDSLKTYIYDINYFLQWGTPEDMEEYIYWSNAFRCKINKQMTYDKAMCDGMTMLIPMAGEGIRFKNESYTTPKPLIEVSGKPMFVQAVNDLPKSDKYIFLCRNEHIKNNHIDTILRNNFSNCRIIEVPKLTEGQAFTCLLAEKEINKEKPLFIASCDNGLLWNMNKFLDLVSDSRIAAVIWTFRKHVALKRNPNMYGWVKVNNGNEVLEVSCKKPISNNPMNDHAIVGSFYFSKAKYFFDNAKQMIKKNIRVNNEFYVDVCMNELIQKGLKVKAFEVDKYLCWGTPNDLKTYQYWQECFDKSPNHPYKKELDEYFD